MIDANDFSGPRVAVLFPTARTLPALALLATSAASRSSLVVVVSLTSGTMTRWRTGLTMARPTLPLVPTWILGATSPRLSGRAPPRLDVPLSSALLALSSLCPLGTPSATTVPQVSYLESTLFDLSCHYANFDLYRKLWWRVRRQRSEAPWPAPCHCLKTGA